MWFTSLLSGSGRCPALQVGFAAFPGPDKAQAGPGTAAFPPLPEIVVATLGLLPVEALLGVQPDVLLQKVSQKGLGTRNGFICLASRSSG